jgi:FkbM family methyltransferase
MIKSLIKNALRKFGLDVYRHQTMARGINLHVDLQRIFHRGIPKVIFDVGANVGQTARELSAVFPTTLIYSFEPISSTYSKFVGNVADLPNIKPHKIALGAEKAIVKMSSAPESGSNRILFSNLHAPDCPYEEVDVERLDEFCVRNGITCIDLLKIDCEGHDLHVLQGAGSLLDSGVSCVYCEINFRRDGRHGDFFAIESLLSQKDYTFYALYDYSGWRYDIPMEGFTNALFIKNKYFQTTGNS